MHRLWLGSGRRSLRARLANANRISSILRARRLAGCAAVGLGGAVASVARPGTPLLHHELAPFWRNAASTLLHRDGWLSRAARRGGRVLRSGARSFLPTTRVGVGAALSVDRNRQPTVHWFLPLELQVVAPCFSRPFASR